MAYSNNFRTLEGFKTPYGITGSKFARSACPEEMTTEFKEELISKGYKTVLDMRRNEEVARKKSGYSDFNYMHIPLIDTKYTVKSELPLRGKEYYRRCLREKENLAKIFRFLANCETGVIYHCAGGKSRTGVVTALLLSLVKVSEAEIVADYCRSYLELYGQTVYNEKAPLGERDITLFLTLVYNNFLSIENFLKYTGVTAAEIQKIKKRLIAN